jgi:hypothetical protein
MNLTVLITLDEYRSDKRFKILDIPYQEAQGVCWARNLTQQLYDGETYTLTNRFSYEIC